MEPVRSVVRRKASAFSALAARRLNVRCAGLAAFGHEAITAWFRFLSPGFAIVTAMLFALSAQAQKAEPKWTGYHRAEARFRALTLQDENGQIPTNALLNAVQLKQQMQVDPLAWPGTAPTRGTRTAGI